MRGPCLQDGQAAWPQNALAVEWGNHLRNLDQLTSLPALQAEGRMRPKGRAPWLL
jgi:hypothetical protein